MNLYIKPYVGGLKLQNLKLIDVDRMINNIKNKGLASKTIRYAYVILKAALNYAKSNSYINENPCNNTQKRKVVVFSVDEQNKFIEEIKGSRFEEGTTYKSKLVFGEPKTQKVKELFHCYT